MRFFGDSCLVYQFIHKKFVHAATLAAAAPSKNNDIEQTSANIRLAQLAYRTVDNDAGIAYGFRNAQLSYTSLYVPRSMRLN